MDNFGYIRVASAVPAVRVADCDYNTDEIINLIDAAEKKGVSIIVFPELSISAYTCGDLFQQYTLLNNVESSVIRINNAMAEKSIVAIVGLPLPLNGKLYNAAAVLANGKIQGIVPKVYLPNYNEFFEMRWFTPASELKVDSIRYANQEAPIGADLLFRYADTCFSIEICEDLWTVIPPSSYQALHGSEIIFNLSASNATVGKHTYRKSLVSQQSARSLAAYVYSSVGCGESSTDTTFAGCGIIADNGAILKETEHFKRESQFVMSDINVEGLRRSRMHNSSFRQAEPYLERKYRTLEIAGIPQKIKKLDRTVTDTPFIPKDANLLAERCNEIFSIQTVALARRLEHIHAQTAVIGISGGLDSTLALLVLVQAFDRLGLDRKGIYGITMPGFGTTNRTYNNAISLMQCLGITIKEISIKKAVAQHFEDINHDANVHDITYENSQARERTQILMDYANKVNGLVIGTGDLSELALGWCTYNGDHMSMYGINSGVPKTLVRTLTQWIANNKVNKDTQVVLNDVIDTPVSPELLPADKDGKISQKTEDVVGPYVLHDFFLYHTLQGGCTPSKMLFLALQAFDGQYEKKAILKWMRSFYLRFFSQQFKRSCMPDGPKIGSVNLSPRTDLKMPSDASVLHWIKELDTLE